LVLLSKLILLSFLFLNTAYARFLVEPAYHHYVGTFSAGTEDGDFSAKVTSLNLGYLGENILLGFTFEKGQYTFDSNVTTDAYSNFDGGGVGTFIGFNFWDRFKIWSSYLNSSLEPTANNDIRYFGQHVSFGFGYRVYEGLMLNLQSFRNQYTQKEDDVTGKTTGLDTNIKTEGYSYFLSYILIF
jgi:hypothetical protein